MQTPTIAEALAHIGVEITDHETLAIVTINGEDTRTLPYQAVKYDPVGPNTYYSTGAFDVAMTFPYGKGRTAENVVRVIELPFDFDLKDYMGFGSVEEVLELPNDEVEEYVEGLLIDVKIAFDQLGLVPHRIDYTGNGIAAFVKVAPHNSDEVEDLRRILGALVTRINNLAECKLADGQVKDAGTRIMRIPFGVNRKVIGATGEVVERYPKTLVRTVDAPAYTIDQLREIAGTVAKPRVGKIVPRAGRAVSSETLDEIVHALRDSWHRGQRHAIALGLSAMLAKSGVPEEQAEYVISSLAADDEEPDDRLTAVTTTYNRYRKGSEVEGYYGLRAVLDPDVLAFVDAKLEAVRTAQRSRRELSTSFGSLPTGSDDKGRAIDLEDWPEPPVTAEYGVIGEYVDIVEPTTESSRGFHLMVGLTLVGALMGRHVAVEYGGDSKYAQLYTMLVGPSGQARKDTAIRRGFEQTVEAGLAMASEHSVFGVSPELPFRRRTDIGSGPALLATLAESPNTVLTLSEATNALDIMKRTAETLRDKLLQAWDAPAFMEDNVKTDGKRVENPTLSIIAATQPGRLEDAITNQDIKSGLLNRFLFAFGTLRERRANPPRLDKVAAGRWFLDVRTAIASYEYGTVLRRSPEADTIWEDWYYSTGDELDRVSETEADLRQRHGDYIHKIALIFAVTDRADRIEACHLQAAIDLVEWSWDGVKRRFGMWGSDVDTRCRHRILKALTKYPAISRRDLLRRVCGGAVTYTVGNRVIDLMSKSQEIAIDDRGRICDADHYEVIVSQFGSISEAAQKDPEHVLKVIRSVS